MTSSILVLKLQLLRPELKCWYETHSTFHPGDAGLDLFLPAAVTVPGGALGFQIDLGIASEMIRIKDGRVSNLSYTLHPRSSIHRTPLRLSNATGIIDAGYRGPISILLDNLSIQDYSIPAGARLVQICAPGLKPFSLEIETTLSQSVRGTSGLGSTGQ